MSNLREETSVTVVHLRSKHMNGPQRHQKLLGFICSEVKACEERKASAAGTLVKLSKAYQDGCWTTVETQKTKGNYLRGPGTSFTNDLNSTNLELQTMPGLVPPAARLRLELAGTRE